MMPDKNEKLAFLSGEQLAEYRKNGMLALPGFASLQEVAALRQKGQEIVREFDPKQISVFTTEGNKQTALSDQYFLDSSSNVSCFFEEKAFDKDHNLVQAKELSINKIGHAMHELVPVFNAFGTSAKMLALLRDLGFKRPLPVQSTFIFKQDSTFLYTEPPSAVGLWLAVEDATKENGCLWSLLGSQKGGVQRRFVLKDGKVTFVGPAPEFSEAELEKFVPYEVLAGTLLVFHGETMHYSSENTSPASRHSYILHVIEGTRDHTWAPDNWLQRSPDLPFRPLYED